jgi:hypothetical protein
MSANANGWAEIPCEHCGGKWEKFEFGKGSGLEGWQIQHAESCVEYEEYDWIETEKFRPADNPASYETVSDLLWKACEYYDQKNFAEGRRFYEAAMMREDNRIVRY